MRDNIRLGKQTTAQLIWVLAFIFVSTTLGVFTRWGFDNIATIATVVSLKFCWITMSLPTIGLELPRWTLTCNVGIGVLLISAFVWGLHSQHQPGSLISIPVAASATSWLVTFA